MVVESWSEWQKEVVAIIRSDLENVLDDIEEHEVDWDAWRPLFEEGRSPQDAVRRAFANDL